MPELVRKILIVGGGTAGWMTAAQLSKTFGEHVQISVIESERIGTIGVGEATFNTIKVFFDSLGLEERDWMPHCAATYKLAIRFVNWNAEGRTFYHPFERYKTMDGFALPEWWLKLRPAELPLDYACFSTPHLCDLRRAPRYLDGTIFDADTAHPYAYHFDAQRIASFLRDFAIRRGVLRIEQDVIEVTLDDRGAVGAVRTHDGVSHRADLFVDCTGFQGLLINQALKEPFVSFGDSLLCDRAVATRLPRARPGHDINPFTTATALGGGWVWDIPLFNGTGTGYVYSSRFLSEGEAETEFRMHLGPPGSDLDVKHLKMRIGRTRNPWVKNCVAIGLSAGFVEPLESTGIFFIQYGIAELLANFPSSGLNEHIALNYNRAVGACIDGVRDFLILHYYLSTRSDTPFWRAVKEDIEIPGVVRERVALWQHRFPTSSSINPAYHGFAPYSYTVMLTGLGHTPLESHPGVHARDEARARALFEALAQRSALLGAELPSHGAYLRSLFRLEDPG
jgi:tryptophan halogenase